MAESKGSLIAKSVQKHAGRAKEKILQNLGKVDRTADDIFDEHLQNFTRQHNAATRLQKEFNNYIRCIRAVQTASKNLMDSLNEIYESQWTGHDLLYVQTQSAEMLWQDFSHKLGDQVLIPLNTYQAQFPEMRKKIEKRNRKLVDYDSQRHNMQSLQGTNVTKKRDEIKVSKARDMLEEAKRTYEMLNSELHDEVPALYDSRVLFLVTNLQTLFAAEQVFHSETAKVYAELEAIVDKLANDCQRGSYTLKKTSNSPKAINANSTNKVGSPTSTTVEDMSPPPSPVKDSGDDGIPVSADSHSPTPAVDSSPPCTNGHASSSPSPTPITLNNTVNSMTSLVNSHVSDSDSPTVRVTNGTSSPVSVEAERSSSPDKKAPNTNSIDHGKEQQVVEELYDIPSGATTEGLPPGVLYRVKATYKYTREDVDELSFEVGEIIRVIQYDDPEEQEEGWLMGVKESSGEKGMFPANFTRPL